MIANVDDIEAHVKTLKRHGKEFLSAIDLPKRERRNVMEELVSMGITAGSLFPGLDGACEELAHRHYDF